MTEILWPLLCIGIFFVACSGDELCSKKKCTGQGQVCVVTERNTAECRCRDSCPVSFGKRVCGSDGITYSSRCHLDMTSCKLYTITVVSIGKCQDTLKVSPTHQSTQTLIAGKPGVIRCVFEGKVAQVRWRKVGMKHLPFSRVLSKMTSLHFRRVQKQDEGKYVCRASAWSKIVEATVNVIILDPKTMDTSVASNRVCNMEKLIGPGTNGFSTRWYFDSKDTLMCKSFSYSGSGGNENNFKTREACIQKCSHAAGNVCSLPKLPGVCMASMPKWFYNSASRECEQFIYGGCLGNANNFDSEEECEKTCSADVVCKLQPEVGRCKGYFRRYFYNHTSGQCDKFTYGGCGGNSNRFHTLELCQRKCQIASGAIVKEKPGRCPWRRSIVTHCLLRSDTCKSDDECSGDDKCCHDGCSRSCARPVSEDKPGQCPVAKNKTFCDKKGDMCNKDIDCPGSRKCCYNGCQMDCSVPADVRMLKPGVCPDRDAIDPKLCKNTKNECELDDDCFGRLKCCFNGCFNECSRAPIPRPKPGECPLSDYIPPENCSDTTDKCSDDSQCPGRAKCCATGCLQECITPPAKVKPGVCPENDYIPPELCEETEDQCEEDEDCKGRGKCCSSGCRLECMTPPIEVKPGLCPTVDYIDPESCDVTTDECSEDVDCEGSDKCCATGCIKECVTPPIPRPHVTPPPRRLGQCPRPWKGLNGICDRRGDMCSDDKDCSGLDLCCFNGCQKDCINVTDPIPADKPGVCPIPWKGQDGICDRRGDMCNVDIDCDASEKCCFNGCQRDCVKPGKRSSEKPGQCPSPWKEQPCDRRGDMCEEDSDCDSRGKCCHNGCQKDCVKPVNLTKCQEEIQSAFDKLASEPPLLGVFVPKCKPDGHYEDQQCHELYCWCVDKNGLKLSDTTVRGPAVCLRRAKPGKCPKPWKGQEGICDYRGDMCSHDSECAGEDDRCCFNGCQNDCVPPVGIKLCAKHKKAEAAKHQGLGFVGGFTPSCKLNGAYEEVQCHGSTGYCWCVDKLGNEMEGTRTRGKPNCTPSGNNARAGKKGTCPKPWKGLSGFCDKMGDECGMDFHCPNENEKCCYSGCQRICANTTETNQRAETKPGQCPKPWLGEKGLCDRRGDMCQKDVDCKRSQMCCFNGCQKDCVNPGLSTCQQRYEESFLFPPLGRFVPLCKKGGRFQETQCHPSTGHCWCVDSYGTEQLGTRTRGRPNCTVPDPCLSTTCPYHGQCVPSKDRKSVECKCNVACFLIYDPVCGTDGKTYGNECSMKSIACMQKQNVTVDYKGECEVVDPCAAVRCGFYGECDVINGSVTCVCPGSGSRPTCGDEKEPVCGSDGEIYDNICHLKDASCQQEVMIRPALPEICEEEKVDLCANVTCSHPLQKCKTKHDGKPVCSCTHLVCPRIIQHVCGDDGKTYDSNCTMDMLSCEANKIVSLDYVGPCEKDITSLLIKNPEDQCAKINCSHPVARCEVINKTATCVCPTIVTLEYFPVCGSDGVTYPNPGTLDIASCNSGGAIDKVKDGKCSELKDPCEISLCSHKAHRCVVQNGTATCVCRTLCTMEYDPVCASDHKTYPNKCAMDVAACESKQYLRVVRPGECDGIIEDKPQICPRPWKGLGGICDLRGDMCQNNADCGKNGDKCCFNGCQKDCIKFGDLQCPQKCHHNAQCIELVIGGRKCVCNPGFEGDGIECAVDPCSVKKCKHYGTCQEENGMGKCVCPQICPNLYAPVCGSDGNVYDNECQMRVESCNQQKKITMASKDTCKPDPCEKSKCSNPRHQCIKTSRGATCMCLPFLCTLDYKPVCGSDGNTYPNKCGLDSAACDRSQNITVASQGECKTEKTNPCGEPGLCTHPYHQCEVVNGKAVCVCPMVITANLDPVCGSDGLTYPNPSALESMSCLANRIVEEVHRGQCVVPTDPCDFSLCSHPLHSCKVVNGMATCVCRQICPLILLPVCGSDGQSYPNNCTLEVEACMTGKDLTVVSMGQCDQCARKACQDPRQHCRVVQGVATCECNEICTADWRPVCGSDGITYPNKCSLEVKACKTGKTLTIVKRGECVKEKQCPFLNPTPSCALVNGTCFTGDVTCTSGTKCCLDNDCSHKCTQPAHDDGTRPGVCPVLNPTPICAGERTGCESDDGCSLGSRCCMQKDCTWRCVKADVIPPPPPPPTPEPLCPILNPTPSCRLPPGAPPNCFTGGPKCHPGHICCLDNDCYHKCVKPALPDGTRPGTCPVPNPIPACASTTGCESDDGCALGERCCLQWNCTKKCVETDTSSPPPIPPLPGGIPNVHLAIIKDVKSVHLTCQPPCHKYGKCVKNRKTGENECSCNRRCTREYNPVCGTDGKTYSTECMMMYLVCKEGTDVALNYRGECKSEDDLTCDPPCHQYGKCVKNQKTDENECSCNRPCTREYNPVCGTDGVTYSTECMMMFLVCKKGTDVALKHPGKCRQDTPEDSCPILNPMPGCAKTSAGCSDDSECADGEKCCLRRDCTKKCYTLANEFDKLYGKGNPCENTLCSYPHPVCKVVKGKATCHCRQNCPAHHDPVCASDGRTYSNMCMLEANACMLESGGMPAGKLTYLGNGDCSVAQICSLPVEKGRCRASMSRFFFNSTSRQCEEFKFGGCEGNANRFDTEKGCHDYCGSLDTCQLNPCPDPYAICSISDSEERVCTCPEICTADYSPVCGTDGQTYSNECKMKASACNQGMMIKVKSPGKCNNNPGFCPTVDPMICRGDQEDSCFDDASCKDNEKCCHNGCRKMCMKPLPRPNAGLPQKIVPQIIKRFGFDKKPSIEDPCEKCKFPRSACTLNENGEAECQCPEVCTADIAPVCGSDGRNYTNKCELEVEACKPENLHTLKLQHDGSCVCDLSPDGGPCQAYLPRYFFNATTKQCKEFIYGGCQGNGNNFQDIESCENKCINPCKNYECPPPHTRCKVEDGKAVCKCPMICTADYRPVCGTDGKTYGNMCGLDAAACLTKHFKLEVKHVGECLSPNPCKDVTCSHHRQKCVVKDNKAVCVCNKICTREYDPYCASDGVTYSNNCTRELEECESGKALDILYPGECKACDPLPDEGPCKAYMPSYFFNATSKTCEEFVYGGCRGNGNRFNTMDDCEKKCKAETPSSDDPCQLVMCDFYGVCRVADNGDAVCECNTACPFTYEPVCGSDGKNYSNECVLKSQACLTKTDIEVIGGPAKCSSKRLKCQSCPARSNLFTHFCESGFVIEGTLEKIESNEETDSSSLMVLVAGVFKGSDSVQNKIIKINFAENLKSCFCKELELRKVVVIAGSVTDDGDYVLDEFSYVRHASKHLLKKVQERTKHNKCDKIKKQD